MAGYRRRGKANEEKQAFVSDKLKKYLTGRFYPCGEEWYLWKSRPPYTG
jgi:hypothetical protein